MSHSVFTALPGVRQRLPDFEALAAEGHLNGLAATLDPQPAHVGERDGHIGSLAAVLRTVKQQTRTRQALVARERTLQQGTVGAVAQGEQRALVLTARDLGTLQNRADAGRDQVDLAAMPRRTALALDAVDLQEGVAAGERPIGEAGRAATVAGRPRVACRMAVRQAGLSAGIQRFAARAAWLRSAMSSAMRLDCSGR
jgi:hypothetical protein